MNSGSFINVVIKPTLLLIEMRVTVLHMKRTSCVILFAFSAEMV